MWAMMEKFRMRKIRHSSSARSPASFSRRPADHDDVEPRPPEEEPAPLGIHAIGLVVAEEPIAEGLEELAQLLARRLRVRAGEDQRDAPVDESQEELLVPELREGVLEGPLPGQIARQGEDRVAVLLQE